jgi:hypothetical protein
LPHVGTPRATVDGPVRRGVTHIVHIAGVTPLAGSIEGQAIVDA